MKGITLAILVTVLAPSAQAQTQPAVSPITLSELEQLALQNNPTTTAAAAGVDAARGQTRQAGAWPNPVIGYSSQEIKTGNRDIQGEYGFFVEQTIPLGGKLRLSRNVFQKTIDQAEAVRDLQRLRILSSVRETFYSVLLTERRIEVQERLAALASEAVGVTAQLFNVGAADRPDYLEIEIEAQRVQLRLNRAKNELVTSSGITHRPQRLSRGAQLRTHSRRTSPAGDVTTRNRACRLEPVENIIAESRMRCLER